MSKSFKGQMSCLGREPAETIAVADADLDVILGHLTLETLLKIKTHRQALVLQDLQEKHLESQNGSVHCILQLQILRIPGKLFISFFGPPGSLRFFYDNTKD